MEKTLKTRTLSGLDNLTGYLLSEVAFVNCSPFPTRFVKKIAFKAEGCWQWTAGTRYSISRGKRYDYPVYAVDGTPSTVQYAHRYSYRLVKGEVPEGLEIDHVCCNKLCVNPDHLEAVTHQENCRRRKSIGPPSGCTWIVVDGKRKMVAR